MAAEKLDYMDYFRAIAILFIVAGHTLCWGSGMVFQFNKLVFAGGTYFFVFIAGFLFQYLSYKFDVKTYYKKKLLNVFCPYFIILLPISLMYSIQDIDNWVFHYTGFGLRILATTVGGYIVNGPLWFMGMIAIIFLFSPAILMCQKKYPKVFITLVFASLICTLIVTRISSVDFYLNYTTPEFSVIKILTLNITYYFRMTCHFLFFYLLGMVVCSAGSRWNISRQQLTTVFFISLTLYLFHFIVNLFIVGPSENMQLISKTIEIFVLLSGFRLAEPWIKSRVILDKTLKLLAKYSFAIFFIHGIIINGLFFHHPYVLRNEPTLLFIGKNTLSCFLTSISNFLIVFSGSLGICVTLKFILSKLGIKNTRFFIGA